MIRRRLTLKRIDPWSAMKFGAVANLALLAIGLIGFGIIWAVIRRLDLIEKFCSSVGDLVLDLQVCEVNGGALFGRLVLLGLLGVIVQTGIIVFLAFLYNLIADLTGGLQFGFLDEAGDVQMGGAKSVRRSDTSSTEMRQGEPPGGSSSTSGTMATGSSNSGAMKTAPSSGSGGSGSGSTDQGSSSRGSGGGASAGWSSQPDQTRPSSTSGGDGAGSGSEDHPRPASSGSGGWRPGDTPREGADDPIFGRRDRGDDDDTEV